MHFRILPVLIFLFASISSFGQSISDCVGAINLCDDFYFQNSATQSTGNFYEFTGSCNANLEVSSVWYTFTVQQSGMLSFVLDPVNDAVDYDWGLFNITNGGCSGLGGSSPQVSCNSWGSFGTNGPTGISSALGGFGNNNGPGTGNGPPFNGDLFVTTGQTFALVVMNWSTNFSGYTLDFSGSSAVLYDNIPPQMTNTTLPCGSSTVVLTFNEPVISSSVQPQDFVVTGPGGTYNVVAAQPQAGGVQEDDQWILTLNQPINITGTYSITITDTNGQVQDHCANLGSGTYNFQVTSPIAFTAVVDNACNGTNGSITVSNPTGGVGPYTLQVNDISQNDFTAEGLTPGLYLVEMVDALGCTGEQNLGVANDLLSLSIPPQPPISCLNPQLTVSGVEITPAQTVDFNWQASNGGNILSGSWTGSPVFSSAGTYTLTVTNPQTGCSAVQAINVAQDNPDSTPPTFDAALAECGNQSFVLTFSEAILASSVDPTDFILTGNGSTWSFDSAGPLEPGAVADDQIVLTLASPLPQGGSFTLTLADGSGYVSDICDNLASGSVAFTVYAPMDLSVDSGNGCNSSGAFLQAAVSSGGLEPFSFTINDFPVESPELENPVAGTYTVGVTDAQGCETSETVTILDFALEVSVPDQAQLSCDEPQLTVSGLLVSPPQTTTYSWVAPPGATVVSGGQTASPVVDMPGTYTVTVTNPETGCVVSTPVQISADPTWDVIPPVMTGISIGCDNQTILITFSEPILGTSVSAADAVLTGPGGAYPIASAGLENPGAFADDVLVVSLTNPIGTGGSFSLSLTLTDGSVTDICGNPGTGTISLQVFAPITFSFASEPGCNDEGGSFTISSLSGGSSPFTFSVDGDAQPGLEASDLPEGDYTLALTDSRGCTAEQEGSIGINLLEAVVLTPSDSISCLQQVVNIPGVQVVPSQEVTYQWSAGEGGEIVGSDDGASLNVGEPGVYTVWVTNPGNGCSASTSVEVMASDEFDLDLTAMVFPNVITPNGDDRNDEWRPYLAGDPELDLTLFFDQYEFEVFNRWGGSVFTSTSGNRTWKAQEVEDGNYYFILQYATDCGSGASGTTKGYIQVVR